MNRYQEELCSNLSYLLGEDSSMLNDTIIEYVELLGNSNRMHELHEYTCQQIERDYGVS